MRIKTHDANHWPPPVKGLDFDLEGPTADHLVDTSHIYNQTVYQNVRPLKEEWSLMSKDEAEHYLPSRKKPVQVMLGIKEKKTVPLSSFESIRLDDHFEYKRGYIINTGGSIWGLDFVPKNEKDDDPNTQYLAVSGYRGSTEEHIALDTNQLPGTYKNAIQIWKLKATSKKDSEPAILDMCLVFDFGVVYDLKWCPYGAYESKGKKEELYRLGILSFATGDKTIRTIVVPHPDAVRKHMCKSDIDPNETIYLHIDRTRCSFHLKNGYATNISWGGHKKIAAGYTTGAVGVWNMESALTNPSVVSTRHLMYSSIVLDAAVRTVCWHGIYEPTKLLAAGFDGQLKIVNNEDPFIPIHFTRIRGIFATCGWSGHSKTILYADADLCNKGSFFNSDGSSTTYKYGLTPGFVWSIGTSEHHGQFALGTSIGWVRSSNLYGVKTRLLVNSQNSVYKLHYNEDTSVYRYIDGIGFQSFEESKTLPIHRQYGSTHMSIQKVVWNPNKLTSGFLASGGAAGLCRIDFEGRGTKWI